MYRSIRNLRQRWEGKAEAVPLPTPSPGKGLRRWRSLLDRGSLISLIYAVLPVKVIGFR